MVNKRVPSGKFGDGFVYRAYGFKSLFSHMQPRCDHMGKATLMVPRPNPLIQCKKGNAFRPS